MVLCFDDLFQEILAFQFIFAYNFSAKNFRTPKTREIVNYNLVV